MADENEDLARYSQAMHGVLITPAEYEAKLAHYAELELASYETKHPGMHFR